MKRLIRQSIMILIGGLLGALIQILIDPAHVPAIGIVIGGLIAFAFSEGVKG